MIYFKDNNNEVYALEEYDLSSAKPGWVLITEQEVTEILTPKIDEKEQELIELNSEIEELEELIKKALIIGNNGVIESLQKEYRSLLKNKEVLSGNETEDDLVEVRPGKPLLDEVPPTPTIPDESYTEPITVAPMDHL